MDQHIIEVGQNIVEVGQHIVVGGGQNVMEVGLHVVKVGQHTVEVGLCFKNVFGLGKHDVRGAHVTKQRLIGLDELVAEMTSGCHMDDNNPGV